MAGSELKVHSAAAVLAAALIAGSGAVAAAEFQACETTEYVVIEPGSYRLLKNSNIDLAHMMLVAGSSVDADGSYPTYPWKPQADNLPCLRDAFRVKDRIVRVYQFNDLERSPAIRYRFAVINEDGEEDRYFLLGNFPELQSIRRDLADQKSEGRLFHLDSVGASGTYAAHRIFIGEPPYRVVRALVTNVLKDTHSLTPD